MKSYIKILCLLMVAMTLILGGCFLDKKSTDSDNDTPTDTQSPSVTITAPTSEATYATNQSTVDLSGTASDDEGVTSVTWANVSVATGASGNCTGTTSWSVSGITLQAQDNLIVITASDAANNTGKDSLTVTNTTEPEGTIKWQLNLGRWDSPTRDPAMGPDGTIYATVTTSTGLAKLYAVTPDGTKKWECELSTWCVDNPVVGSDGTIYAISYSSVDAVSPNGTLQWEWVADPVADINGLTLGDDGTIYVGHHGSGAYYRKVFAINPNGTQKWSIELSGSSHSGLTIGQNGEVYVSDADGESNYPLYAVDPDNGSVLWSVELGDWVNAGGMAVGSDGSIYVPLGAGSSNKLVAISPNHTISWEYTLPASPGIPSIGPDGTIYVIAASGYVDGDLYALTSSGTLKWNTGNSPAGHSVAIASDGTIYFCGANPSPQGNFTAVNPDGSIKWTLDVPTGAGSPLIGSDGTIYVSGGNTMYEGAVLTAIYGSSPLASSSWSRGRHDNSNTGSYGGY
jgi:outer membrane protein assembly factor BamB